MNSSSLGRCALSVCVAAALLTGCNSGSSWGLPSGLVPGGINRASARAHFHPHRLWAAPDIARYPALLFISHNSVSGVFVNMYSLPDLTLKGKVGGFRAGESLMGECADRSGNIWVTGDDEYAGGELIKLAHNGQLLGSIQIYNDQPYSCAVDPTTGNLAVTENGYNYYNPGAVVIFARARGTGKVITNPQQFFYRFDGYDTSGNLWEDGSGSGFILSRCSASSCSTIPISGGKIYGAGFVQWAVGQKSWYIGDVACNNLRVFCIYPVSRSGRLRTPIQLSDPQGHSICQTSQAVITSAKSRSLVGSFYDYNCGGDYGVARWNFPAGGLPTNFTTDVFGEGAAISYK